MRNAVIFICIAIIGVFFMAQKRHDQRVAVEQAAAAAQPNATPRPVSEHNWAKHSLDTTSKVINQVATQRKEDAADR